jgi:hypothetical protein
MAQDRRSLRALAALLPAGVLGLSVGLASADAVAAASSGEDRATQPKSKAVAARLEAIRNSVSDIVEGKTVDVDAEARLAWWGNGGWRNGGWGWHNGGWHNGGWGNGGWHNGGWGNGGWHNGGWHNGGWGNGWHNW